MRSAGHVSRESQHHDAKAHDSPVHSKHARSSNGSTSEHDTSATTDTLERTVSSISSQPSMATSVSSLPDHHHRGGFSMQSGAFRLPPIAALSTWDDDGEAPRHQRSRMTSTSNMRSTSPNRSSTEAFGGWEQRARDPRRMPAYEGYDSDHQTSPTTQRRAPPSLELSNYRTETASLPTPGRIPGSAGMSTMSEIMTPTTPSVGGTNRADNFMASLMRAAQPPRPASDHSAESRAHSPMSVHSMIEKREPTAALDSERFTAAHAGTSAEAGHTGPRTRKRRTSSVQEPLQGSALEGAERGKGYPRYSEPSHHDNGRSHYAPQTPIRGAGHSSSSSPMVSPSDSFHSVASSRATFDHYRSHSHNTMVSARSQPGSTFASPLRPPVVSSTPMQNWPSSAGLPSSAYTSRYPDRPTSVGPHRQGSSTGINPQGRLSGITSGRASVSGEASLEATLTAAHWNAEIAAQAAGEEERWAGTTPMQRRQIVSQSIWDARKQLRTIQTIWPPEPSNVTTIRCMYANIAQKSYGSEKRFLCPPPTVKINGPLRPCRWATMRVVSGEAPSPTMSYNAVMGQPNPSAPAPSTGGEESAVIDMHGEARFGKLHVGGLSDGASKVFRLQVNLLRADADGRRSSMGVSMMPPSHASQGAALTAWSTIHTAPINVISKPARKSVRTRAASPAIASGSTVCLYNRLNSQTVRTKYLGVESFPKDTSETAQVTLSRRLLAKQDGWDGFSIELLARPYNDPAVARAAARGLPVDDLGITYGSIVCLRDVNTKLCSDPMLICKVDKGRVELSSIVGGGDDSRVRFQIVHRDREEARTILLGGARRSSRSPASSAATTPALSQEGFAPHSRVTTRDESDGGSEHGSEFSAQGANVDANPSLGGPVIQMQKITLMSVSPIATADSHDVECDLSLPRSYLSSTASENSRESPQRPAMARSTAHLRARVERALSQQSHVTGRPSDAVSAAQLDDELSISSVPPQAAAVGYARPPLITSPNATGRHGQADALEDQFCWTIVTISCTETSYIEANAISRSKYPHLPSTTLPITPFPSFASSAVYDPRSHSVSVTVLDFLYTEGLDADMPAADLNTLSATQAGGIKVAHEIWLGHNCVLRTQASSAGPHMSDVTFQLPPMETLLALHRALHEDETGAAGETKVDGVAQTSSLHPSHSDMAIRIPVLFVRVGQGISFPSGRWLLGRRPRGNAYDYRSDLDPLAWAFRVA